MKKTYPILILVTVLVVVLTVSFILITRPAATTTPTEGYEIVKTYPHDTDAFTEGLVYDSGYLYESTGLYGSSTLRRVDIETGAVLKSLSLSNQYFGEGTTIIGDEIIQLTYRSNVGFVYNKESFALIREFTYPTEGWGLTYNGSRLIMSDGSANLYFLDPTTFERVGRITVLDTNPVSNLNELEYIKGKVYANVFGEDKIAVIDPKTGKVDTWIDLSSLPGPKTITDDVLNGIAYDSVSDRLFVTGKMWSNLYEIKLKPTH
jgi:glutamine cyclotransferase